MGGAFPRRIAPDWPSRASAVRESGTSDCPVSRGERPALPIATAAPAGTRKQQQAVQGATGAIGDVLAPESSLGQVCQRRRRQDPLTRPVHPCSPILGAGIHVVGLRPSDLAPSTKATVATIVGGAADTPDWCAVSRPDPTRDFGGLAGEPNGREPVTRCGRWRAATVGAFAGTSTSEPFALSLFGEATGRK